MSNIRVPSDRHVLATEPLCIKRDGRDVAANTVIGFDQPIGALTCTARVAAPIDKTRQGVKPRVATH